MSYLKHALNEFKFAGWLKEDGSYADEMQKSMCEHVLELLEVFSKEGHSGFSAPYAINLFSTLAKFKTITPLTGEDSEWNNVSDSSNCTLYQNKRNSAVFKGKDGAYDIDATVHWEWYRCEDGTIEKTYFHRGGDRTYITFPYTPPATTYIFCPTEEFPDENMQSQ